jgi:hypothetical protein
MIYRYLNRNKTRKYLDVLPKLVETSSILQLYWNVHINCSVTLFYCYLGWRCLLKLVQNPDKLSGVSKRILNFHGLLSGNSLDSSNCQCLRLNKSSYMFLPSASSTQLLKRSEYPVHFTSTSVRLLRMIVSTSQSVSSDLSSACNSA